MDKVKLTELYSNGSLESVQRDIDDGWRHGNYIFEVFKYKDRFYGVNYQESGDGEYNTLRDGYITDSDIEELIPIEENITIVKYVKK